MFYSAVLQHLVIPAAQEIAVSASRPPRNDVGVMGYNRNRMKKIPDQAKRVFEGKIFDVYQWEQVLFDDSKAIFESLKRSETVTVIPVTEDGKIMLIEEEQPQIPLHLKNVAGKVDPGEKPEETAKRELLEETGYESNDLELWYTENPIYKIDWTVYTYVARGCKKVGPQKLEGGERITPILLSFDEFIEKVLEPDFPNLALKVKILEAKLDPQKMKHLKSLLR